MKKLIVDLHLLKTTLEMQGCWYMAAEVHKQLERQRVDLCHFCQKPVSVETLKNHPECMSKLYDVVFEKKAA